MSDNRSKPRYPWLRDEIASGTSVVTASRRLARDLTNAYADQLVADGQVAWRTPPIHAWPDWVARLLSDAPDPAGLPGTLDSLSASVLWERCLRSRVADHVLNFSGVVRQTAQTWQRLSEWSVPVSAATVCERGCRIQRSAPGKQLGRPCRTRNGRYRITAKRAGYRTRPGSARGF